MRISLLSICAENRISTMRSTILLGAFTLWLFVAAERVQEKEKEWWETTTIYQIYPRSFMDSNGDGIGDLNGIYEKLDYIKGIGIETVWIQPFYKSPMADFGYDVSDFREIEPMFGTMHDFKKLIAGIHERGMKLVMDLVPNHVSDDSEWFKKSVNREDPYTDFFLWKDSKGFNDVTKRRMPPNNWLSIFGGSAWEWNDKRKQFYYKQFSKRQPDLNFRNPEVQKAMKDVMRFWLDLGVDGFRIDAIKHLVERADFKDEPYLLPELEGSPSYDSQDHIYTVDQEETYEIMHDWRLLVDEYKAQDGKTRILCTEAYTSLDMLLKYFGNSTYKSAHFPFYFGFVEFNYQQNAADLNEKIHQFMDEMPKHGVANWVVSNHDNPRLASRTAPEFADAMNILQLLLPGVASVYYGDEIGMSNALVRKDQTKDPNNGGGGRTDTRDAERSPMQWDNTMNAGFTRHKVPWLPINADYWYNNVRTQEHTPRSHLNVFKQVMKLRNTKVIKNGDIDTCILNDWMYLYVRKLEGEPTVAVIVNLGSESEQACAQDCLKYLPDVMDVYTSSVNSAYLPGDKFATTYTAKSFCSVLRPKAAVVLTSDPIDTHSSATSIVSYSFTVIISLIIALFTNRV
ncbi:unnamed protein product [Bemisia tabaci]|uniref:alpha-glucosidase n=1 Tax=Bemisia tabaci TaxID=7038 RepID=A0A9P0CEN2_BEMTA|nr:PREDICTED: maltase A1-like [Bemisia tabaci]CAH0775248.1 unnamed protein product [Bemisia tabaci]